MHDLSNAKNKSLQQSSTKKAFTLFELAIGLALLTGIVFCSMSFFSAIRQTVIRNEVEKLHAAFLYLQRKAVLSKETQTLIFNRAQQSYTADHEYLLFHGIIFGVLKGVKGPPSQPMKELVKAITWLDEKVIFYADGTISAGAVYITDQKALYCVSCDASEITHIRTYAYNERWILLK